MSTLFTGAVTDMHEKALQCTNVSRVFPSSMQATDHRTVDGLGRPSHPCRCNTGWQQAG